jgi:hypothetical protein
LPVALHQQLFIAYIYPSQYHFIEKTRANQTLAYQGFYLPSTLKALKKDVKVDPFSVRINLGWGRFFLGMHGVSFSERKLTVDCCHFTHNAYSILSLTK